MGASWQIGQALHGFPRLYAAASLKRGASLSMVFLARAFSAALCRGLIEARHPAQRPHRTILCFPRLYAAASLKHGGHHLPHVDRLLGFPRLYAAASLKQTSRSSPMTTATVFSAALCRGLIEAPSRLVPGCTR